MSAKGRSANAGEVLPRLPERVTPEDLAAVVESQREFVAQRGGGKAWRCDKGRWTYGSRNDQPSSLEDRDLKGLDLRGVVLRWANLRACRGPNQNLARADLTGCLLARSDLSGATLRGARLEDAVLEDARLAGAKLLEVSANRAVFARADLTGASFRRARLRGADFSDATLTGCDFRDADIEGASFDGAWLVGARIDWGPRGFPEKERYRVQKVTLKEESEGPDYFSTGEFQVIDQARGEVVARFPWSLDEPYLSNKGYSGPEEVRISEDGSEAIARDATGAEERVLLSGVAGAVALDGIEVSPVTKGQPWGKP